MSVSVPPGVCQRMEEYVDETCGSDANQKALHPDFLSTHQWDFKVKDELVIFLAFKEAAAPQSRS